MFLDRLVDHLGEVLILPVPAGETDEPEARRQEPAVGQVIDGRHELLAGQVARDAEDHQHAGARDARQPPVERVTQWVHVVVHQ